MRVPGGYLLEVDADHLDALRFDELTIQARPAYAAGDPGTAVALFGQALACGGGRSWPT